ncbi:tetratricopeptide repeat protein [Croceicoccus mobilis]|uniref:Transcriptional regulator n=1 Tax=Croceicoccus mobilis TaxID=1703339 RepID=A0A916Z2B1_9SPHN|nr:tetratricopeptide repeat protein [Croceicoccus mobilis]GGD73340.1 transcriptional regulator [Croceicoccus mobilis]
MSKDKPISLAEEGDFALADLQVRPRSHEVWSVNGRDRLEPRVMQVLVALARAGGEVVSREELIASCWAGRIVGESAVHRCIVRLRKLGKGHGAFTVQSITKTGYRLRPINPAAAHVTTPATLPRPVVDRPSLAVLPFRVIAMEEGSDFLADGMQETLIAALSRLGSCFVISRGSSDRMHFGAATPDPVATGRSFGVSFLIEGSVQRIGPNLRVQVELVETRYGNVIWSDSLSGTIGDFFALQDAVVETLVGQVQPSIQRAEIAQALRKSPGDLNSYDCTMQAMAHVWQLDRDACAQALTLLERALVADPDYPLALALAGWCHAQRSVYNWSFDVEAAWASARSHAERAAQASDDPLVLTIMGAIHSIARDTEKARLLIERALAIDPNSAIGFQRLGWLEVYCGRPAKARKALQRALRLSPFDPMNFNVHAGLGSACELSDDHEAAIAHYHRALRERPSATWIYRHLASAHAAMGQDRAARAALNEVRRHYPDLTVASLENALAYPAAMRQRMCSDFARLGLPSGQSAD